MYKGDTTLQLVAKFLQNRNSNSYNGKNRGISESAKLIVLYDKGKMYSLYVSQV